MKNELLIGCVLLIIALGGGLLFGYLQNTDTNTIPLNPIHQGTIFALGDSLTEGYGVHTQDAYPAQLEKLLTKKGYGYTVVNGGKSGEISSGLLENIDTLTQTAKPGDIAILVIGANDGLRSKSLEDMEKNIAIIIEQLQEKKMQVLLGGMKIPTSVVSTYGKEFTKVYPRLAKKYNIPFIPFFLKGVAGRTSLNFPDRMHPNEEGYTKITKYVADFLIKEGVIEINTSTDTK